VYYVVLHYVLE